VKLGGECKDLIHMEKDGKPFRFLLDIVELAMSHSGINLAQAFKDMLTEFGVEHNMNTKMMKLTKST
jgi:hypothetical protein